MLASPVKEVPMSEERPEETKGLPLEWHIPDELSCQYATNLVVQHTEHEFIISFFRASPPILLGPAEDVEEKFARLKSVRAECVARVIVAPGRMKEFVQVLKKNLELQQSKVAEE
jgi:hypothetical protein